MKLDRKFAEAITNALVDRINKIEESNWERPWFDNVAMRPKNIDGKEYRGVNNFLIMMVDGGREIPVYMTFMRAKKEGLNILSGEKSLPVQYASKMAFNIRTRKSISIDKYEDLSPSEQKEYKTTFMVRHYNVFNVDQTNMKEVKPDLYQQLKDQVILERREIKEATSPLISLFEEQLWYTPIKLDRIERAYYSPKQDMIHLPKREFFKSDDLFYSTALHEMAHSTGHESRLNRDIINLFGTPEYAKEELIAELSAAIVGQQYNVSKPILEGNAQYLKSWLSGVFKTPDYLNEILEDVIKASDMIIQRVELAKSKMQTTTMEKETHALQDVLRDKVLEKEITGSVYTPVKKSINILDKESRKKGRGV